MPTTKPEPKATNGPSDRLLRQFAGYNMKRAYMQIRPDLESVLKQFDLRIGTFSAMAVVKERPGLSQSNLAEFLQIKRSGVVVLVDELEQLDAVERRPAPHDRRANELYVTPPGMQLWTRAEAAARAHEAALFADLSTSEIEQLQELLSAVARSAARHRQE